MTKSNNPDKYQLKGTDDMMKELNKSQGRYVPVWMQAPTDRLKNSITKPRRKPSGNKKENSRKNQKSTK